MQGAQQQIMNLLMNAILNNKGVWILLFSLESSLVSDVKSTPINLRTQAEENKFK